MVWPPGQSGLGRDGPNGGHAPKGARHLAAREPAQAELPRAQAEPAQAELPRAREPATPPEPAQAKLPRARAEAFEAQPFVIVRTFVDCVESMDRPKQAPRSSSCPPWSMCGGSPAPGTATEPRMATTAREPAQAELPRAQAEPAQAELPRAREPATPPEPAQAKLPRTRMATTAPAVASSAPERGPTPGTADPRGRTQMRTAPMNRRGQVTTLMIRNLPIRANVNKLFEHLDELGFRGQYDYVHFPVDIRTRLRMGYAFVNFSDAEAATRCKEAIKGTQLRGTLSPKTIAATAATHQGVDANIYGLRRILCRASKGSSTADLQLHLPWVLEGNDMRPMQQASLRSFTAGFL